MSLGFLVLIGVSVFDGGDQLGQFTLVLGSDLGQSENSSSLLVNDRAKSGLTLDDRVWNTHLLAESWKEDNQLNWINIIWNQDQSSLLVLDETDDVVKTILDSVWLLGDVLLLLSILNGGGLLYKTLLLLGLALWAVFIEEFESLGGGVAVEDVLELGDRRWDLETEVQDLLLALKTDILGPLHHTGEVSSWLDVLTDAIVTGALLDEGILHLHKYLNMTDDLGCLPLGPSLIPHQLSTGGMGLGQPSFRTLEAIIEKRRHQRICSLIVSSEL